MAVQKPQRAPRSSRPAPEAEKDLKPNRVHLLDVGEFLKSFKQDDFFDLAIIDPPYNLGKDFGNNKDRLELKEYIDWSLGYLKEVMRLMKRDAPVYVYGFPEVLAHVAVHFPVDKQRWLAWHYTNKAVPSSKFWQRSYESILCLWQGDKKPTLNIDDIREDYTESFVKNSAGKVRKSKNCRYSKGNSVTVYNAHEGGALPRDVVKVPALAGGAGYSERIFYCKDCDVIAYNSEKEKHQDCKLVVHPTQKPMKLTEKLIRASAPSRLLIPFAGSGSECVMAKRLGVDFYSTDMNNDYVTMANKWLQATKPNSQIRVRGYC